MKMLVFGKTGQLALEMARHCPGPIEATFLDRESADLSRPDDCARIVAASRADVVVNAAAWTGVDEAETHEDLATVVNGRSPGAMAAACAVRAIPFVHLSSDYVFDGSGERPHAPDDPVAPLNAYGRSKLAGELAIRESGARHLILRTSWVVSMHGRNFVKSMLRLGGERQSLKVVEDQVGGPTPASALAVAVFSAARDLVDGKQGGTHHFAGAPDVSWAVFARAIMATAGLDCKVVGIPSREYPTPARRPNNSRLDCSQFVQAFGIARPSWQDDLKTIIEDIGVHR